MLPTSPGSTMPSPSSRKKPTRTRSGRLRRTGARPTSSWLSRANAPCSTRWRRNTGNMSSISRTFTGTRSSSASTWPAACRSSSRLTWMPCRKGLGTRCPAPSARIRCSGQSRSSTTASTSSGSPNPSSGARAKTRSTWKSPARPIRIGSTPSSWAKATSASI